MTYAAGLIGAGGAAGLGLLGTHQVGESRVRASHAGGYHEAEGIDLIAVADIDPEALRQFREAWNIDPDRCYQNHEAMLEAEDLDAISIATPTYLHHEHVIDAAKLGSPGVIWCEKPIASSLTQAEEMIGACEETEAELVINHTLRFTGRFQRLRDLIQTQALLGDIDSVHARFRMELMRNSTHLLDSLVYVLDTRADRVAGHLTGMNEATTELDVRVEVDDSGGGGIIVMEDGTIALIDCTNSRRISSMQYDFVGTVGKLYLNNDDGEWRFWRLEDGDHVEADLPGISGAWTWGEDYEEGFPNAANHVVDLLDGRTANISTGEEATKSLAIVVALFLSAYTGSYVSLPLERPLRDIRITSW